MTLLISKGSFYRAFNTIYSRCCGASSELSAVFLLKSYCLPIVNYALEALLLNRASFKLIQSAVDNAVRKIFKVNSTDVIRDIRLHVGLEDIECMYHKALCKFLLKLYRSNLSFANTLVCCQLNYLRTIHNVLNIRFYGDTLVALKDIANAIY